MQHSPVGLLYRMQHAFAAGLLVPDNLLVLDCCFKLAAAGMQDRHYVAKVVVVLALMGYTCWQTLDGLFCLLAVLFV